MIESRGCTAVLEVDDQAGIIFGHTIGMADQITCQGRTVDEARAEFARSVDAYLEGCIKEGREPGKPFSGKILVRIPSDVHRRLALDADARDLSLNDVARPAFVQYLDRVGSHEPDTEVVILDVPEAAGPSRSKRAAGPATTGARAVRATDRH